MSQNGFEPRIVAFLCNWCTYTGADLAGTSRLQYPPNVRIIRLMCSGAVDASYVLKPLLDGADGVLIEMRSSNRGPVRTQYMLLWQKNGVVYGLSGWDDPARGIELANSLK